MDPAESYGRVGAILVCGEAVVEYFHELGIRFPGAARPEPAKGTSAPAPLVIFRREHSLKVIPARLVISLSLGEAARAPCIDHGLPFQVLD
jgi:hypothetical protein